MSNPKSSLALLLCCLLVVLAGLIYFPRWKNTGVEATIGWDVAGYYMYLPAIFIYHDIKKCSFKEEIFEKYQPTPHFAQAIKHSSGNYVMLYTCGQAIQFLPFFGVAHFWASISSEYPADGFSFPYQLLISLGSLLIALIGLYFLRKLLLEYFEDWVAAGALISIVFGTNYLDYAAINGAMTHNNLFTIYVLLIYTTKLFYKEPKLSNAIVIGSMVGLAALTRPTEIISVIIPLAWGANFFSRQQVQERLSFLKSNIRLVLIAAIVSIAIGLIQAVYWKYASGDWFVYTYEEKGFNWLNPHIFDGLLSYKSGWLIYTPLMIFGLIGFVPLYRANKAIFATCSVFIGLFIYIAFSWDIWWYGGSLGQRTMVQAYPILAFPLASFILWMRKMKWTMIAGSILFLIFIYTNLWFTHQAHHGGIFYADQMTRAYFWKTFWKYNETQSDLKLLDTKEEFNGKRTNILTLYYNDFESETINCSLSPIQGSGSICLNETNQSSDDYFFPMSNSSADWIRASADFRCQQKEWDSKRMTQFLVRFYNHDEEIKKRKIRIYRLMHDGQTRNIFFDTKCPKEPFNKVGVSSWNAQSNKEIVIDNLKVESFIGVPR